VTRAVAAAEARINATLTKLAADQRESCVAAVDERLKAYDELMVETIVPLERQVRELHASIDALRAELNKQQTIEGQVLDLPPLPLGQVQ
jgi:hypothetical protein